MQQRMSVAPRRPRGLGGCLRLAAAALVAAASFYMVILLAEIESAKARRPNVILIQVDDMDRDLLRSKIRVGRKVQPAMPRALRQLAGQGTEFTRYYSSNPICGPSRASLLTGLSTHNHGMLINAAPYGYTGWKSSPHFESNLPIWLRENGYRTAHIGKYFNGYRAEDAVPPGWDRWVTNVKNTGGPYYESPLNIDGQVTAPIGSWRRPDRPGCKVAMPWRPGACLHATDVQTAFALREIRLAAGKRPFFLSLDFNAPHDDGWGSPGPEPPARYRHLVNRVEIDLDLEDDLGNETKPVFIRALPPLAEPLKLEIERRYAREVVAMRSVDDAIGRMIRTLRAKRSLGNTYLLFLSDNGMFHGEHLIAYGKYLPHEPATRQPLLIRGPAVAKGARSTALASNLDIASTVLAMTGSRSGTWHDGRSLLPFARQSARRSSRPVLLEGFNGRGLGFRGPFTDGGGSNQPNSALVTNFTGFVAGRWKYVRYFHGEEELYDLRLDPKEHHNLAGDPRLAAVTEWSRSLSSGLEGCRDVSCRPEVAPPARP